MSRLRAPLIRSHRFSRFLLPAIFALALHAGMFLWPFRHEKPASTLRVKAIQEIGMITLVELPGTGAEEGSRANSAVSDDAQPPPEPLKPPYPFPELAFERNDLAVFDAGLAEIQAAGSANRLTEGLRLGAAGASTVPGSSFGGWGEATSARAGAKPLVAPLPPYPPGAQAERRSGVVEILVVLNGQGLPISASVARSSGFDDFDHAAKDTVRRHWRFPPNRGAGAQANTPVLVAVHFDLLRHEAAGRPALVSRNNK